MNVYTGAYKATKRVSDPQELELLVSEMPELDAKNETQVFRSSIKYETAELCPFFMMLTLFAYMGEYIVNMILAMWGGGGRRREPGTVAKGTKGTVNQGG